MPVIKWTPAMSVGVEALDTDHKMLIGLINQLADAVAVGDAHDVVASIINALVDYTEYHFGREEEMMRACGYAEFNSHVATHGKIVETLQHLRDAHAGRAIGETQTVLLDFMRAWLTDHIMGTDMQYAPIMRGCKAELARVDEAYTHRLAQGARIGDDDSML